MKDIFTMWKYPKMITLTAICAAIYAALLIPFKAIVIFSVEVRVATVIVPVMGILFGPAGAWGVAIGNLIGDFFGSMSVASIFGFIANFFFAYVPYKVWYMFKGDVEPKTETGKKIVRFLLGSLGGSLTDVCWLCFGVCAVFSQLPYPLFASIIGVTNGLFPLVLGAAVLSLVGMRIKKWGLAFTSIMKAEDFNTNMKLNILGAVFLIVAPLIAIVISLIMSANGTQVGTPLVWVSLPALVISLVGSCLIGLSPDIFEKPEEE